MNLGTIWGRFVEKTGGQKSRATVPLREFFRLPYCIKHPPLFRIEKKIINLISASQLFVLQRYHTHFVLLGAGKCRPLFEEAFIQHVYHSTYASALHAVPKNPPKF